MESPMTRNNGAGIRPWQFLTLLLCLGAASVAWSQSEATQTSTDQGSPSQVSPAQSQSPAPPGDSQAPKITIGPGDQVDIEVFDTPELSGTVRVSQTGEVNLTVLGNIQIAGLTPNQAARKIESELKARGLLVDPHVTVAIGEYANQGATLMGEVHTPGVYPTLGTRRLLEMIALAGGPTTNAGRVATIIHRDAPQHPQNIVLVATNNQLGAQENPVILPGDTVVIGRAGIIYVLGDVTRAGGYLIDNNEPLSLIQALTLAGGWTHTTAQSKVILIRKVPEGREEIKLDLSHMVHGEQADIKVRDGDIVFLPSSIVKIFAYQGIGAVIAAAEQAVIYTTVINH
jgi:polysaccharide biosynthesis/export protein